MHCRLIETGQAFKLSKEFHDDRWRSRIVTWLDWSPLVCSCLCLLVNLSVV